MGSYQQWNAKVRQVRDHVQHTYTGNTMTGASHVVAVQMALETPGQHNGRPVWMMLTPSEARWLAGFLTDQADRSEEMNEEI